MPTSVEPLIHVLKIEHDAGLLAAACTALGLIGDPQSLPALEWALTHAVPVVRLAAAHALVLLGEAGLEMLRSIAQEAVGGDAAREVLARHVITHVEEMADLAPTQLQFRFN